MRKIDILIFIKINTIDQHNLRDFLFTICKITKFEYYNYR